MSRSLRAWHVALVVNLALVLGVGLGYAWWGRRTERLAAELYRSEAQVEELGRELAAARASGGATAGAPGAGAAPEQLWDVRGVIRAVVPELNVVVITHEEIPGYMPSMTMGFRAAAPEVYQGVRVGDVVRFTLRGAPPNVVVTAIRAANS